MLVYYFLSRNKINSSQPFALTNEFVNQHELNMLNDFERQF
jgi:hypothetical protein